jgi:hypothetical protein
MAFMLGAFTPTAVSKSASSPRKLVSAQQETQLSIRILAVIVDVHMRTYGHCSGYYELIR